MDRFLEYMNEGDMDSCWLWTGPSFQSVNKRVGQLKIDGKLFYAPRLSYEYFYGEEPNIICHRCPDYGAKEANPLCCNPLHLHNGTKKDNRHDMIRYGEDTRRILSDKDVEDIRKEYHSKVFKFGEKKVWHEVMSKRFGVSPKFIEGIIYGYERKNVYQQ